MFGVGLRLLYTCLFVQTIAGKSIDLEYGYQEIDDKNTIAQIDAEETKHIVVDRLSDEALEEICKNFKVTIHIRETDSFVNCLESPFDNTRQITLVKRDASGKEEDVEGSGDSDDQKVPVTEKITETTVSSSPAASSSETTSEDAILQANSSALELEPPILKPKESNEQPKSESPVLFQSGFDAILKNVALQQNISVKEGESPAAVLKIDQEQNIVAAASSDGKSSNDTESPVLFTNGFEEILKNAPQNQNKTLKEGASPFLVLRSGGDKLDIVQAPPNDGKFSAAPGNEIAKIGESAEKPSAASPNSVLLIVFAAMGIVGALAFTFNFIKNRREDKEIDEVMKLEQEGRELKEMKPLMKSPLAQNGAKSLEYIDAEPQNGSQREIRVEVRQDLDVERHSN